MNSLSRAEFAIEEEAMRFILEGRELIESLLMSIVSCWRDMEYCVAG